MIRHKDIKDSRGFPVLEKIESITVTEIIPPRFDCENQKIDEKKQIRREKLNKATFKRKFDK